MHEPIPQDVEDIGSRVLDCAFKVHRELGSGLFESAYQACLCHELRKSGIAFECERALAITYGGEQIDAGYRLDIWVERKVILELKAVENVLPIHRAQLLTYLRLSGNRLGFLINFNVTRLKDGIERLVL